MAAVDRGALEALREQLGNHPEVIDRVLGLYLDELEPRLDAIRSAAEAQDAPALRDAAHSLRGSSATLGATLVADICERIESDAAAGNVGSAQALLARLEPAAEETAAAFRAEREGTS